MKKVLAFGVVLSLLFSSTSFAKPLILSYDGAIHKYEGAIYKLKVNNEVISTEIPPVVINNASLVPARAVFEKLGASVQWDIKNKKVLLGLEDKNIELTINSKKALVNNKPVEMSVPPKVINEKTMVPVRFVGEQLGAKVDWLPKESTIAISRGDTRSGKFNGITYSPVDSYDKFNISIDEYKGYKISRLSSPDRIVVDIPGTGLSGNQQKLDVNSGLVKSVRYAQFDSEVIRIVLDTVGQPQFNIEEKEKLLVVSVESPLYKNIAYVNNGDRVCLRLDDLKLTEGGETVERFYSENYEDGGKKYTITFPATLGDLGSGTIKINDGLINTIQVVKDESQQKTSIVFDAKDKFSYETMYRGEVNSTAITILKPAAARDKLVVIDPGHGGIDPGAVYGDLLEKQLNLDIALKLNSMLKKNNVKTYMIREDDSFIGLFERAYIANTLNAALFLSIHNNAIGDPDFGGTMTLHFPQNPSAKGFNGKVFAEIIQNKLLAALKTKDRRIIERPNLVVLKATNMPAALAEVAYMTNKNDRNNLLNEEFRNKAAKALCDALLQSLGEIK